MTKYATVSPNAREIHAQGHPEMSDPRLPSELQHLQNLIEDAQSDTTIRVLRKLVRSAADEAPATDVIRMAQTILQCGIDIERSKRAGHN
jgi:hypothetical protein